MTVTDVPSGRSTVAARDLDRVELTKVQNQLAEILAVLKAPPAP